MKPSLQLKIGQQLTMTPQLQQAIRLLQLSSLELQSEIQEALESNPMLEMNEEGQAKDSNSEAKNGKETVQEHESTISTDQALQQENVKQDLPVDTQWENWDAAPPSSGTNYQSDPSDFQDYQGQTTESLQDHLFWQMNLTPFTERDIAIATAIIDSIEDDGYLSSSLTDIRDSLGTDIMPVPEGDEDTIEQELDLQEREILAVLRRIQCFDPVGVGARDLHECLSIQLAKFDESLSEYQDAKLLLEQHFDDLGSRNYKQIMRKTKFTEDRLRSALQLIQTLDPKPGHAISDVVADYVTPDVFVFKDKGRWIVELSPDAKPSIRINDTYASYIKRADNSPENTYLQNNLQEAKWFLKSLNSRNETLMNVARCIVDYQLGFFEYGEEAMRPLVLSDIAEKVEMHESTISRVTTQKYMHTPRGIYELKYFFSSHVATATGGECSSTAIKALIKKLIAAEESAKPLSDSKLATILSEQGIKVARRTVAKYREALAIPPSNERKSLL